MPTSLPEPFQRTHHEPQISSSTLVQQQAQNRTEHLTTIGIWLCTQATVVRTFVDNIRPWNHRKRQLKSTKTYNIVWKNTKFWMGFGDLIYSLRCCGFFWGCGGPYSEGFWRNLRWCFIQLGKFLGRFFEGCLEGCFFSGFAFVCFFV